MFLDSLQKKKDQPFLGCDKIFLDQTFTMLKSCNNCKLEVL